MMQHMREPGTDNHNMPDKPAHLFDDVVEPCGADLLIEGQAHVLCDQLGGHELDVQFNQPEFYRYATYNDHTARIAVCHWRC
eukprot:scaffold224139_cov27-Prasinocladus_malaysianus.AAC.1